jgi:hypothetical protein
MRLKRQTMRRENEICESGVLGGRDLGNFGDYAVVFYV